MRYNKKSRHAQDMNSALLMIWLIFIYTYISLHKNHTESLIRKYLPPIRPPSGLSLGWGGGRWGSENNQITQTWMHFLEIRHTIQNNYHHVVDTTDGNFDCGDKHKLQQQVQTWYTFTSSTRETTDQCCTVSRQMCQLQWWTTDSSSMPKNNRHCMRSRPCYAWQGNHQRNRNCRSVFHMDWQSSHALKHNTTAR